MEVRKRVARERGLGSGRQKEVAEESGAGEGLGTGNLGIFSRSRVEWRKLSTCYNSPRTSGG